MHYKKKVYRLFIFLFCFETMFPNISYADIFTNTRNAIIHPVAIHYCERHVRKHFSAASAEKVCACTWNKLTAVKGEISAVIAQITRHKNNASLKKLEKQQIIGCAYKYHAGKKMVQIMDTEHQK